MYLKKLRLKNFRSHVDSVIEFGPTTSIVGSNSAGKTSIVRALKLVLHNEDFPEKWIHRNYDKAEITVELVDGTAVTRTRTRKGQTIEIRHPDGKMEFFVGKKDAQSYVEKALGVCKVTLDEATGPEDLNFTNATEGPYMIGSRPDSVQRKICGILGINEIEDARTRLMSKRRKSDGRLEILKESLPASDSFIYQAKLSLESLTERFDKLQDLQEEWNELNEKRDEILELSEKIHNTSINTDLTTDKLRDSLHFIEVKRAQLENLYKDQDVLERCVVLSRQQIDLAETKVKMARLLELLKEWTNINAQLHTIELFQETIEQLQAEKIDTSNKIADLSAKLSITQLLRTEYLQELGVCPICGANT